MRYSNSHSGYSVIIALFVMSFLLVLTTWVFRLVLSELTLNRWEQWYIQAYAGATSARELALLHIKQNGYGDYDFIEHSVNNRSVVLSEKNRDNFALNKDVFISYDLWYRVDSYKWSVSSFWYDIIPLFSDDISVSDIDLDITSWDGDTLVWNILWDNSGLAGLWSFDGNTKAKSRTLDGINIDFWKPTIKEFLSREDNYYLIIFNSGNDIIDYTLESAPWEYFTLPRTQIISSAQVGEYRQNLQTNFDNTEFLGILRYSIFSPNIE